MTTAAGAIVAATIAALERVESLSGRVSRGTPTEGSALPWAWVRVGELRTANGPDLTGHQPTLIVDMWVLPTATGSDWAAREEAALEVQSAILSALIHDDALLALCMVRPTVAFQTAENAGMGSGFVVVGAMECVYMLDNRSGL